MDKNTFTVTNLKDCASIMDSANDNAVLIDKPVIVNKNDISRLIDEAVIELQILERKAQSTFAEFKHPLIAKLKKLKTDLSVNATIVK
jgi:hypothetical protein